MHTTIDPFSVTSLNLECFSDTTRLGSGTGFVITKDSAYYLVTNWHVVSGKDPVTKLPISLGQLPNKILVWQHVKGKLGSWISEEYPLISPSSQPLWIEKTLPNGDMIDVILLKIAPSINVELYTVSLDLANTDLQISPSEPVSIIGFPYNRASDGKFPIWKTGHVASDIDLNFENRPVFLIDAMTKPGMSGSPVIARRVGSYVNKSNNIIIGGPVNKFMGIYSGRTKDNDSLANSNLGVVWKPSVINSLLP